MTGEPTREPTGAAVTAGALLALATDLATEAGRTITGMRAAAIASATTKSSPTDAVTEADRRAEAIIVAGILDRRPDDGIIGEEGTDRVGRSGVVWYIDPIDGTTNYLYGIPAYAVSIAATVDGSVVAGVVYNPAAGELYAAEAGSGAALNGQPISCSANDELPSALVATGFGYLADRRKLQAAVTAAILPAIRDLRRFGSAALDLCAVANGRVDAYFEAGLNSWDLAAGWLIAVEAGAVVDDLRGGDPSPTFLLASTPGIHHDLTALLRSVDADRVVG